LVDCPGLRLDEQHVAGAEREFGQPLVCDFAPALDGEHDGPVFLGDARRLDRFTDQIGPRREDDLHERLLRGQRVEVPLVGRLGDEVDALDVQQRLELRVGDADDVDVAGADGRRVGGIAVGVAVAETLEDLHFEPEFLGGFLDCKARCRRRFADDHLGQVLLLARRRPLAPGLDV
jgi:hypothetical protein